jgi:Queuosine biosynthesis protein QueC
MFSPGTSPTGVRGHDRHIIIAWDRLSGRPTMPWREVSKVDERREFVRLAMRLYKTAEVHLVIGSVRSDRKHADGTANFLKSMRKILGIQKADLVLEYPAYRLSTETLIRDAKIPIEILGYTFSCHSGPLACGRCPDCVKNLQAREFSITCRDGHPTKRAPPRRMLPSSRRHASD